ncbi:MAG: NTP transferase domain-containing protein [Gammaproteobacteria bacterium]|nr:NTP transferase domain-containing protein [Gammaproteobacteria bacterium]
MSTVLSVILAGGAGKRLQPLTLKQAKPALNFAYRRRIIDFVLSNLWHSGFQHLLVLTQYQPQRLHSHLLKHWQPRFNQQGSLRCCAAPSELNLGTAGAVARELSQIRDYQPDHIAVLSADHIYKMDYAQMLAFHQQHQADVTVAAIAVPVALAHQFGVFIVDANQRIQGFIEKPQHQVPQIPNRPGYALVSMGNYLFHTTVLEQALNQAQPGIELDFGHHILPQLISQGRCSVYDFSHNQLPGQQSLPQYWRDVGTLNSYFAARLDILSHPDWLQGEQQAWPILGRRSCTERLTQAGAMLLTKHRKSWLSAIRPLAPAQHQHQLYC